MLRLSPKRKFLKSDTSVLKIEGWRMKFLGRLPISPAVPGLAKQVGSIRYGDPEPSNVPGFLLGSQTSTGRALNSPPLKSVMEVERQVVVDPGSRANPGAQAW